MKETMDDLETPPNSPPTGRLARAAALMLMLVLPSLLAGQRAELERHIKRSTLPNGLEVIVVENHGVPLVTIEADVKNGSFTQGPEYEGLSHLYEHMFFKANAAYPNPDDFVARASELGAQFNGTTSEERVNYYLTVPADSIQGGMSFLGAALMTPLFRKDELEREREVVIGEYDRNESSPFFQFNTSMSKALWTTAWSRKNPLGERAVIQNTTPEKMRAIEQRYYIPNNTAIIITGDVTPDKAFALARSTFGNWKAGPDPSTSDPIPPIPPLVHDTALIVEQSIGSVFVMLQWQGPSATKDPAATYAADVFSDVLNQPGSRFQRRLVDSGLFQSIGFNYYTLNQVGPISVFGQTSPQRLREALAALHDELKKVDDPGYFSADELNATKRHRIIGTELGLERASGFAQQLGFWWAVTGLDYFFGYVDTMAKQTPADLQAYANKYIIGKPHVVGVLLSPEVRRSLNLTTTALLETGVRP
ncbi:MAG TPA: pitrilysin family protein [Gemmatimonadaceae bacterium]|jgi:zinc protease|nr:pitrilysin family protein [Gemmatimonadaceae bacterium]